MVEAKEPLRRAREAPEHRLGTTAVEQTFRGDDNKQQDVQFFKKFLSQSTYSLKNTMSRYNLNRNFHSKL